MQVALISDRELQHLLFCWLIAGLIPWFFFQEVLSGGTNALMEYSYLVKKVVFQIDILPIIKLISACCAFVFYCIYNCFICVLWVLSGFVYIANVILYLCDDDSFIRTDICNICNSSYFSKILDRSLTLFADRRLDDTNYVGILMGWN